MRASELVARVRTRLAAAKIDTDTEIRTSPGRPYYLVTSSAGTPRDRRLDFHAPDRLVLIYVMAVNNNPAGASDLADRAVGLLDGYWLEPEVTGSGPLEASFVAPVIDAGEAPGDWRWSCTAEFRHHTGETYVQPEA